MEKPIIMSVVTKTKRNNTQVPETWIELLETFYPLYPIHTKADYNKALAAADKLIGLKLSAIQQKYLESLCVLIEAYEDEHFPIDTEISPLEAIKFLCRENDLSASDLGRILGDRSLGSKILNGKRQLSKTHIARLSGYFSVEPGLFF